MKKFIFGITLSILIIACSSTDDTDTENPVDNSFDREAMLTNIADNIIIPGYQKFYDVIASLKSNTDQFTDIPNQTNLDILRATWSKSYIDWQSVAMFEIGKAEELSFRNFMNVFPVTTEDINKNISDGSYDLGSVTKQDEQGLSGLDYLINGIASTDADILEKYTTHPDAQKYRDYLTALVDRIESLTKQVLTDWTTEGYRTTFITNNGSSATSSIDKMVNDYIFHYEKHLRAGKIGIPAGIFSDGATFSDKTEAFYKKDLSKILFFANLDAMQGFFNGKHFSTNSTGESLSTYLKALDKNDLVVKINDQFDAIRTQAQNLDTNLAQQVTNDNTQMTQVYDKLQANVVFLKVDMLQTLGISVSFVDTDGD